MVARRVQGQSSTALPRSLLHCATGSIAAKPSRQHPPPPATRPTDDVQVLPHHALGVGAQEHVEVQDPARRAPGQGWAGLQEHVWGSTSASGTS